MNTNTPPFAFSLHGKEVGHTLTVGPTSAGKSAFFSHLFTQREAGGVVSVAQVSALAALNRLERR